MVAVYRLTRAPFDEVQQIRWNDYPRSALYHRGDLSAYGLAHQTAAGSALDLQAGNCYVLILNKLDLLTTITTLRVFRHEDS